MNPSLQPNAGEAPLVSVSIVSHGQGALVDDLVRDVGRVCAGPLEIILTQNIPEPVPAAVAESPFPVHVIANAERLGFGANHNQAFRSARGRFYCVLNPDIRLEADPFPPLIEALEDRSVGVAGPLVRNSRGETEDSARPFPHPLGILLRVLGRQGTRHVADAPVSHPDWVGGMFMLFRREDFAAVGGFDERYFLYYEDVDLCARFRIAGRRVAYCTRTPVVHDARRDSHRSARYLSWHARSMLRFFASIVFARVMLKKLRRRPPAAA